MTVTIRTTQPHGTVGPGLWVELSSDFIGPVGANSKWNLAVYMDAAHTQLVCIDQHNYLVNDQFVNMFNEVVLTVLIGGAGAYWPANGDTVYLVANLFDGASHGNDDTGSASATWASSDGLGFLTYERAGASSADLAAIRAAVIRTFPAP